MASLILPVLEACAAFRLSADVYFEQPKVRLNHVPVKEFRFVTLDDRKDSCFAKQYHFRMPFLDMEAMGDDLIAYIRKELPWTYRLEDDGLLWRVAGSQVETHYSLDHDKICKADLYHEWSMTPHALPNDKWYNKRVDMLDRSQAGLRAAPVRVDPRGGKLDVRPKLIFSTFEDKNTVIYPGEDRSTFWSYLITTGDTNGGYLETSKDFFDSVSKKKTVGEHFSSQVLQSDRGINGYPSHYKHLRETGKGFCNKLHLPMEELYEKPVKAFSVKSRIIALEEKEHIPVAKFESVVRTRDASVGNAGVGFIRLGVRFKDMTPVLTDPSETLSALTMPSSDLLVHKAQDGWRFIMTVPMYIKMRSARESALGCTPMCYMIPQYVDRNEVTFSTKAFRGVSHTLQKQIWDTRGMSMAIHRALMGFTYEITKLKTVTRNGIILHDDLERVPREHKVSLYGEGWTKEYSLRKVRLSEAHDIHGMSNNGRWVVNYSTRVAKPLPYAMEIVDEAFFGAQENELLHPYYEPIKEIRVNRSVRI